MTVWFTTSFNKRIWDKYGEHTLGSFLPNSAAPSREDEKYIVWLDTNEDLDWFRDSDIPFNGEVGVIDTIAYWKNFIDLFGNDIPFKQRGIDKTKIAEGIQFRYNYIPFAKKVFSWVDTYFHAKDGDLIVWLDADLQQHNRITSGDIDSLINDADLVFLDRDFPWYAAETGFFILRKCEKTQPFVEFVLRSYLTGFIFDMSEWHDGYIFKTALKMTITKDMKIASFSIDPQERDVFDNSCLTNWFTHYKGPRKQELRNKKKPKDDTVIMYDPEDQ